MHCSNSRRFFEKTRSAFRLKVDIGIIVGRSYCLTSTVSIPTRSGIDNPNRAVIRDTAPARQVSFQGRDRHILIDPLDWCIVVTVRAEADDGEVSGAERFEFVR